MQSDQKISSVLCKLFESIQNVNKNSFLVKGYSQVGINEISSMSNLQYFTKTSLGVYKKFLSQKNFPQLYSLASPWISKYFFIPKKNIVFGRIWAKFMILIQMFRGIIGLSTLTFFEISTLQGGGRSRTWNFFHQNLRYNECCFFEY